MRIVRQWTDRRQVHRLRRDWEAFRSMVETHFQVGDSSTRNMAPPSLAAERRFLAIKAQGARRLSTLERVIAPRALVEEALIAKRNMAEVMTRVATLASARQFTADERENVRRDWSVLYLFLAKLEGAITGSRETGAALIDDASAAATDHRLRAGARNPRARTGSRWARVLPLTVEVAIAIGFVTVAASFIGIGPLSRRNAGPGNVSGEGAVVVQAPTGETEVTAPAAPSPLTKPGVAERGVPPPVAAAAPAFKFRMPRVVQPVILRYGTVGTFVLFGAFVSGLLLVFGVRSR